MKTSLANIEVIHFIGIGGIGMSGLAKIMYNMGFKVQGSDLNYNKNIERLKKINIPIFIGHNKKNLNKATMIVASSAIKKNNPEIFAAKYKKLPIFSRGEMLANVVSLKKNIVISGAHGKTTTTSLISNILVEAGLDPTVINGGIINSINSSAKLGSSEWAVIESDESDGSFLDLPVTYSVITNIDKEHMEFYKKFDFLKKSFKKFIEKTPSFGKSFVCIDNKNISNLIKKCRSKNILTYGFSNNSNYQVINIKKKNRYSKFDLKIKIPGKKNLFIRNIKLNLIGDHNVSNATAAIAIALNLGIKISKIKNVLSKFTGIQRRFTKIFSKSKRDFYDDYAHHPTEIKALLKGIKSVFKKRKIISVFQPHRYSRVNMLKKDFAKSFKLADEVVLCPIYSAGEKNINNLNQDELSNLISKHSAVQVINVKNKIELTKYLRSNLFFNELVVCMGAGSISSWIRSIANEL